MALTVKVDINLRSNLKMKERKEQEKEV